MGKDNPFDPSNNPYAWFRQELINGQIGDEPLPSNIIFQVCVDLERNKCYLVDDLYPTTYSRVIFARMLANMLMREADSLEYRMHKDELKPED